MEQSQVEGGRTLSNDEKVAMMGGDKSYAPPGLEKKEEQREPVAEKKKEEEDKKEEPVAEKKVGESSKVEEGTEETEKGKKEDKGQPDFLSAFNSEFEKEFTEIDQIKELFDKAEKYGDLKSSKSESDQKLAEYKRIAEGVDPMQFFASEDEYIRQQFLKQNKDKLTPDAIDALAALSPERVGKLSDVEALTFDLVVDKGLTSEEAQAYLKMNYEVDDFGSEDIDAGTRAKIKVDVKGAKDRLSSKYEGITIPEKTDWETQRIELKQSWETPVDELVKGIDKIQLDEGIDFVVDPSMKEGLRDEIMATLVAQGIKPSEATMGELAASTRDTILSRNMDKVVKSLRQDIAEQEKAKIRSEVHNDQPVNTDSKEGDAKDSNDDIILGRLGKR